MSKNIAIFTKQDFDGPKIFEAICATSYMAEDELILQIAESIIKGDKDFLCRTYQGFLQHSVWSNAPVEKHRKEEKKYLVGCSISHLAAIGISQGFFSIDIDQSNLSKNDKHDWGFLLANAPPTAYLKETIDWSERICTLSIATPEQLASA